VLLARLTGSRPDPPTPVEETVVEVVEAGGLLTEAGRSGPTAAP